MRLIQPKDNKPLPAFDERKHDKYKSFGGWLIINLIANIVCVALFVNALFVSIKYSDGTGRVTPTDVLTIFMGAIYVLCSVLLFVKTPKTVKALHTIYFLSLPLLLFLPPLLINNIIWELYFRGSERVKYYFGLIKRPRTFRPVQNIEAPIRTE